MDNHRLKAGKLRLIISLLFVIGHWACSGDGARNDFDLIRQQFPDLYRDERRDSSNLLVNGKDSLWVIRSFINDEVVTRGYTRRDKFVPAFEYTCDSIGYYKDTVFDANYDGRIDYVIKYYSGTGCCPRHRNVIFLCPDQKGSPYLQTEVMNAFFDEKNKTVLDMSYGYPDPNMGISLTKSVWSGYSLKGIESIWWGSDSAYYIAGPYDSIARKITRLPEEYRNIPMVDWFSLELPGRE